MILTVFSDPALFNNIFLEGILRMLASEYELHRNVSRAAVNRFFETCREAGNEIHTLQIYQNGEKMLRIAPSPYSCTDKRENYSLSKSFASTGIGFAIEEGLLRTDDRIVDLFPDKLPDTVDDHLAAMRLSHVLSMNTGHAGCVMPHMYHTDDVARAFLAQPVPFRPGTHFAYNTGATCLLSALVQRVSGETLFDYVNRKLFVPLGIRGAYWNQCGEGVNEGGVGLHLSSDDIIKFALLCLNGGVWEGKRIISEAWLEEATRVHSDNSSNGTPDWTAGYGYQFWRNAREGYRGDGACGQLCVVLPKRKTVAVIQAMVSNMQKEMDDLFELIENLCHVDQTPAIIPAYEPLPDRQIVLHSQNYRLDSNPIGFTFLRLDVRDDAVHLHFSNGRKEELLSAGRGRWIRSVYTAPYRKPKLLGLMSQEAPEEVRVAACCEMDGGSLRILCRHINSPQTESIRLTFTPEGDAVHLRFEMTGYWDAGALDLSGVRV